MLDVCLLGTGGMMPLPRRWLTSLMTRYNGSNLIIDCGEGTQIAIKQKGWSVHPIDIICITHFHADHISGLPGLLLSMGNADRREKVTIIGPRGIENIVNSLRIIAPELPFPIEFIELSEVEEQISLKGYNIEAFKVKHNVVCYGYNIKINRTGRFDVNKAKELDIPKNYWSILQKGKGVIVEGETFYPEMVMGEERKGLKVTYCTDTRPTEKIAIMAKEADLFICEGMYGEKDKDNKAKENKHMTFEEAAKLASYAKPKEVWLTHYSPSLIKPEEYIKDTRKIFENIIAGKDGMSKELVFEDED